VGGVGFDVGVWRLGGFGGNSSISLALHRGYGAWSNKAGLVCWQLFDGFSLRCYPSYRVTAFVGWERGLVVVWVWGVIMLGVRVA